MSTIKLKGSSSGEAEVTVAAAAGTPTFTLPTTVGSANQLLKNSGTAGTLEFSSKIAATSDQVLIGTSTPSTWTSRQLVVGDTSTSSSFIEIRCSDSSTGHVLFSDSAAGDANNYTGYIGYNHASNHMSFHTDGGNERVVIDDTGDLKINDGDLIIGTSGHGIDFSATSDATGKTSELLDDYEEGTFTPTIENGITNPSLNTAYGSYTKIGRVVHFQIMLTIGSGTGNSNQLQFGGLPYVSASSSSLAYGGAYINYQNNMFSEGKSISFHVPANQYRIQCYRPDGASLAGNDNQIADITTDLLLTGQYQV